MNCIICKSERNEPLFGGIVKCNNCSLVYYDSDNISKVEVEKLYDESYFKGAEYYDYESDKSIIQKNFHARLREVRKRISSGTLFEIGSAYGYFLDIATEYYIVEGIDITEKPTEYARKELGLKVKTGSYIDTPLEEKKDVFCMWDTIEHLHQPDKYIEKISHEIKPGGYFFLTTGNIGSILAKVRGARWRMIHPPTHLYYFSADTMTRLLKKYGFDIVSITHPGIYRNLKQIMFSLFFLNKSNNSKFRSLLDKVNVSVYLNTYDVMQVIAQKKS